MHGSRRRSWCWAVGLSAVCLLAISASPRPVAAETIDDGGLWFALFGNGELNLRDDDARWRWWFDGQLRLFDDSEGFGQSLIRPGIGYQLTEKATLWGGYAWIHTDPGGPAPFDEHRLWQQLTWSHNFEPTTLDLRSRLEQRLLETGDDTGLRFRQLAAIRRPLEMAPRFTLVAWDEIFIHLNDTDWGARSGFDQNRAFLGLGWKPTPACSWRLELGYLHQFIDRTGAPEVSNHLLSVNLFWSP